MKSVTLSTQSQPRGDDAYLLVLIEAKTFRTENYPKSFPLANGAFDPQALQITIADDPLWVAQNSCFAGSAQVLRQGRLPGRSRGRQSLKLNRGSRSRVDTRIARRSVGPFGVRRDVVSGVIKVVVEALGPVARGERPSQFGGAGSAHRFKV